MASSTKLREVSHFETSELFLEKILSQIRFARAERYINKNSFVADLGCGYNGFFLKKIAKKIKKGVGFDVSVATTNLQSNIVLKKANLNKKIITRKNYYDAVVALAVLEHIENPESFLMQAKAIIKSGGCLILTTPHKRSKRLLEFLAFKIGIISKEEIGDHKHYFDEKSLEELIRKIKLHIVKLKTFGAGFNILLIAKRVK